MRSSKSRSRSKANRPRTLGNIINRVFDSSGPEGKVRGTPQQIIEKYQMLAGDAQRSNDRVAAENFSQHAEHYTRMLAEAQREMAAEQEQRQPQGNPQHQQNNGNGNGGRDRASDQRERADYRPERNDRNENGDQDQPYASGFAVVGEEDAGLVDLPEVNRQQQPRRDDNRRDNRAEQQPRRQDRPRDDNRRDDTRQDRPRDDNRRDDNRQDRPRDDNRRDPRPAPVAAEPPAQPQVAEIQPQLPRFESPAALVAQIEEAAAQPKPRPPRATNSRATAEAQPAAAPVAEPPVKTRAPRVRKPVVKADPDAQPKADTAE